MHCRGPSATPRASSANWRRRGSSTQAVLLQVGHIVDDFRFRWDPLRSDSGVVEVHSLQERQDQGWVAHDVTVVHVT